MVDDQCRHAFGLKQEAHLRLTRDRSLVSWEEFVRCQVRANETYSEAKLQLSDRNSDVLVNVQYPHQWWPTLNAAVFGSSSSLPLLVSEGGGMVCESFGKADHFDSKQSREAVNLQLTCHPSPRLTTFALRSSGATDPLGMFPLFLKRTADVMAPRLSVVFRRLVRLGSFPACWRLANVTPIRKKKPSSSVDNCRKMSITSVLSKLFERLMSVCLGRFMERSGVLPTTKFAYQKGLVTCDAHLCLSHTLQSALERGQEARIVQIDSVAFDRIKYLCILYKLCSVGIGGSILSILTEFLSN